MRTELNNSPWRFSACAGSIITLLLSTWYLFDHIILSPFVGLYNDDGSIDWLQIRKMLIEFSLPAYIASVLVVRFIVGEYPALLNLAKPSEKPALMPDEIPLSRFIICTGCGEKLFHDGSVAGSEIPCPHCKTLVKFQGKLHHNQVAEEDYHFEVFGHQPIQAEGRVLGYPFFFRAKYDFWDFTVITSDLHMGRASQWDSPEQAHGYLRVEDEGEMEWEGYWLDARYGSGNDAGMMDHSTAIDIIKDCIRRFIQDERSPDAKKVTVTQI